MIQTNAVQATTNRISFYNIIIGKDLDAVTARCSNLKSRYICPIGSKDYCTAHCPGIQKRTANAQQADRFSYVQALSINPALNIYGIPRTCPVYGCLDALCGANVNRSGVD